MRRKAERDKLVIALERWGEWELKGIALKEMAHFLGSFSVRRYVICSRLQLSCDAFLILIDHMKRAIFGH